MLLLHMTKMQFLGLGSSQLPTSPIMGPLTSSCSLWGTDTHIHTLQAIVLRACRTRTHNKHE